MLKVPTLLLLDDQLHVLATRGRLFSLYGYKVALASNASEAMDVLKNQSVGVIIVDYRILNMDGKSILEQIKHLYPDTAIIMLNENNEVNEIVNIKQMIKENVIQKYFEYPFEDYQFLDCIKNLINTYQLKNC